MDKNKLQDLINKNYSTHKIANDLNTSQTNIRYWLKKYNLKTNHKQFNDKRETQSIVKCENCLKDHNGEYGSGRFCEEKCSRSFSSKINKEEKNKKISAALKNKKLSDEQRERLLTNQVLGSKKFQEKCLNIYKLKSWDELSFEQKRRRVNEEQNFKCLLCSISEWRDRPINLRLDHIDGNNNNNSRENCRMICPNCDSQLDTYCGRNKKKVTDKYTDEELYNCLKKNNFIKYRVIKELNMTVSKYAYRKLNKIIEEMA